MARARSGPGDSAFAAAAIGFDGGLNIRDAINQLAPNECRKLENGLLDERGGFAKRLGCLNMGTFGTSGHRVLSMYTFYRAASDPQLIINTSGGKIYYTADPLANPITWTEMATGLSTTAPFAFETFNNKLYMSNGVDDYASWDGTTRVAFASAPKGKYLRLWKDTMWVAGVSGLPDRIHVSDPGNAEVFGVASWVDIAKGDGDFVTTLASDGLFLIVGKRNRSFIIYDPVTLANRVVDFEKGFESHFGAVQFESYIYFLSRRGICQWLGDTPSRFISNKIDPLFDPAILNLNALTNAFAYTHENRIGWALPEVGSIVPTMQIEYYPRLAKQGRGETGPPIGPWAVQRLPGTVFAKYRKGISEYLYCSHSTANKVLQAFSVSGQDDSATFSALLETGGFDFGQSTLTKYIRRVRFVGRGALTAILLRNFRPDIYKNFEINLASSEDLWSVSENWGAGLWGPDSLIKEQKVHPDAYARFFQFRFTDGETGAGAKLIPVGARDYRVPSGEWAIYGYYVDGSYLGVRD